MFRTVKSKFTLFSIIFIVVSVSAPMYFLLLQFRQNFNQRSIIMLETTVDILTSGLDNIMMLGYQKNIQHVVEKISHNKDINHVRIFNIDGMILYASDSSEVGKNMSVVAPEHVELNF